MREKILPEQVWYRLNTAIFDIDGAAQAQRHYFKSQAVAIYHGMIESSRTTFDVTVQEVVCFPNFGADIKGRMPEGAIDEGLSVVIWRASDARK